MSLFKKIIDHYANFVAHHPFIIIFIAFIFLIGAVQQAQNIETKGMNNKNMLPSDLEVMKAMDLLDSQFGGSDTIMFAVQLDPKDKYNTVDDIRDPEIIEYMYILGQMAMHTDDVMGVTSGATVLKQINNDHLPKSISTIKNIEDKNPFILDQYMSKDHTMALVKISLSDGYNQNEIVKSLIKVIEYTPKPNSVITNVAGDVAADPIVQEQLAPDSQRTSMYSMIGIVLVLLLLFKSIKYAIIPLTTIGVGVTWAFGFIGLTGMSMSTMTSGVISMIMGIGIDFGIQTVTRFRQELKVKHKKLQVENALIITLNKVIGPMGTTTLAALIGFKSMSMGQLTMMAEMGTMMSYGLVACFVAAITIVPALLIVFEKFKIKNYFGGKK